MAEKILSFREGGEVARQDVSAQPHAVLRIDHGNHFAPKVILPPEKFAILQERIAALDPFLQQQIKQNPAMIAQLGLYEGLVLNPPKPAPFNS